MFYNLLSSYSPHLLVAFNLSFCRVLGFFIVAPYFTKKRIPMRFTVYLSLALAFITSVFSLNNSMAFVAPADLEEPYLESVKNLFIGLVFGAGALIMIEVIRVVGGMIAFACQLGFVQMVDPSSEGSSGVVSNVLYTMFSMLFIASGGLLVIIKLLLLSFTVIPLSGFELNNLDVMSLTRVFSLCFSLAITIALPFTLGSLLLNIGLAVISKSAPSFNLFSIGFPLGILLGVLALGVVIDQIMFDLYSSILAINEELISSLTKIER